MLPGVWLISLLVSSPARALWRTRWRMKIPGLYRDGSGDPSSPIPFFYSGFWLLATIFGTDTP